MTDAAGTAGNTCYRHPDRQSFVLCQRCGRTICPSCQTQAAVGVHCPNCVAEARGSAPRAKSRARSSVMSAFRPSNDGPVVTYSIMALCVVVFIVQSIGGNAVTAELVYVPGLSTFEPWRFLTSIFAHASIIHILFNMYSLYIFGPVLERTLGRGRYLVLYLLAGFGGSVAVLLLAPFSTVLGASGAIFGLMGAFFVIQRGLGGTNNPSLLIVIGLNLVLPFIIGGNISWQAHLGGLIVGGLAAFILVKTRNRSQRVVQAVALTGLGLVLVAAILVRIYVIG
jgi:membrane associated rhomboid family serine protease